MIIDANSPRSRNGESLRCGVSIWPVLFAAVDRACKSSYTKPPTRPAIAAVSSADHQLSDTSINAYLQGLCTERARPCDSLLRQGTRSRGGAMASDSNTHALVPASIAA